MNKILYACLILLILTGCAVNRKVKNDEIRISFLDEYIIDKELQFEDTQIGGLSGIDRANSKYYLVCDQSSNPRIYKANIDIQKKGIDTIYFEELINVSKPEKLSNAVLDLEAIRYDADSDEMVITSEGLINENRDPGIFRIHDNGKIVDSFNIPEYFEATGAQKPRNNGVFEGLSESFDKQAYWVATELPLEKDGAKPKLYPTRSHIRITRFDKNTGEPVKQFVYKLDGISKLPINYFAVNGVTEILEYAPEKFLILERAYSAGYGSHGNTVKIFAVDATQASNTLEFNSLKGKDYELAEKSLVFNFKSVKDRLTDKIIDNLEGMCFGPELGNGNRSLIVISDNNFNSYGEQLNQFILLELNFMNAKPVTD